MTEGTRVACRLREERPTLMESSYMAANACICYLVVSTCWERLSVGADALARFKAAGEPHWQVTTIGFPGSILTVGLFLSGELWSGRLRGSAEAAATSAILRLDPAHTGFLLCLWEAFEASWNGVTSLRVATLSERRTNAGAATRPVRLPPRRDIPLLSMAAHNAIQPNPTTTAIQLHDVLQSKQNLFNQAQSNLFPCAYPRMKGPAFDCAY